MLFRSENSEVFLDSLSLSNLVVDCEDASNCHEQTSLFDFSKNKQGFKFVEKLPDPLANFKIYDIYSKEEDKCITDKRELGSCDESSGFLVDFDRYGKCLELEDFDKYDCDFQIRFNYNHNLFSIGYYDRQGGGFTLLDDDYDVSKFDPDKTNLGHLYLSCLEIFGRIGTYCQGEWYGIFEDVFADADVWTYKFVERKGEAPRELPEEPKEVDESTVILSGNDNDSEPGDETYFLYNSVTKKCLSERLYETTDCSEADKVFLIRKENYNNCIKNKADKSQCNLTITTKSKKKKKMELGIMFLDQASNILHLNWVKDKPSNLELTLNNHIGDANSYSEFIDDETSLADFWVEGSVEHVSESNLNCHRIRVVDNNLPYLDTIRLGANYDCNNLKNSENYVFRKSVSPLVPTDTTNIDDYKCEISEPSFIPESSCSRYGYCSSPFGVAGDTAAFIWDYSGAKIFSLTDNTYSLEEYLEEGAYYYNISTSNRHVALADHYHKEEGANVARGIVNLYQKNNANNSWTKIESLIPDVDDEIETYFGASLSLDDDILAIASPGEIPISIYIYRRNNENDNWALKEKVAIPWEKSNWDQYRTTVAVKKNLLLVVDEREDLVDVWEYGDTPESVWTKKQTIMEEECEMRLGSNLLIDDNGNFFASCLEDINDTGVVYYYEKSALDGEYRKKNIRPSAGITKFIEFGDSMALLDDILAVSDPKLKKIYIFRKIKGKWIEVNQIPVTKNTWEFGTSVGLGRNLLFFQTREGLFSSTLNCPVVSM
mgnify:CR=1 FL=1